MRNKGPYKTSFTGPVLSPDHRDFFYIGMAEQGGLDFCYLDPMTSDIYLKVFPAEVDKTTIRQFTAQIASTIDTLVSCFRIGEEYGFSKFRISPITWREIFASHSDFAN